MLEKPNSNAVQGAVAIPLEQLNFKETQPKKAQKETEKIDHIKTLTKLRGILREVELAAKRGEKTLNIEGLSARFKIETTSDVYGLNKNFEGKYAREIINACKNLGKDGHMVNVGSAQGFYSIYSALAGNAVVAVEPDPITFQALEKNIELNNLTNKIECLPYALGDKSEEKTLFTNNIRKSAPSFIETARQKEKIVVPVFRMDEIAMHSPDIVVIDVEGYEENVIRGMGNLRPKELFVEIHPYFLTKMDTSHNNLHMLVSDMGYGLKSQYKRRNELLCHYHREL